MIVRGQYANLSRGKHCAKHVKSGQWASKDENGDLVLNQSGRWMLHTSDGFSRKETIYITLDDDCKTDESLGRRFEEV